MTSLAVSCSTPVFGRRDHRTCQFIVFIVTDCCFFGLGGLRSPVMKSSSPSWDPAKYLQFESERARAWHDLVARLGDLNPATIVDLGCGPGHLTATLSEQWPAAHVTGVDSSAEMMAVAASLRRPGRLDFQQATIEDWHPDAPVDLLISNAALHWVPSHLDLMRKWVTTAVAAGGVFAFQMPAINHDAASEVMHQVTTSPRWAGRLGQVAAAIESRRAKVRPPQEYAEALIDAGCQVDAWHTTYVHAMPGDDPMLDFLVGTGLRPHLDILLDPAERSDLCADMAAALRHRFPRREYGTLVAFPRVFGVARPARGYNAEKVGV
jgi:trans-aconitate 2-methyltransferase